MPPRPEGHLFAVGGRETLTDLTVLSEFVRLCGGSAARLLVVTTSSDEPTEKRDQYTRAFRALGVTRLAFLHHEQRAAAGEPGSLQALEASTGLFFVGGSQLKLVSTIAGTPFEERIRARHTAGMHIGGTSAGASAMSTTMIAGGKSRTAPRLGAVHMSPGLGLIREAIVDQHFRERDRFGRLFAAVLCNPALLGFGLDENTAFSLDPNGWMTVIGSGALTIVDGSQVRASNMIGRQASSGPMPFSDLRVHALTHGWRYDLNGRTPQPEAEVAVSYSSTASPNN